MEGDLVIMEEGIPIFNPVLRTIPEFKEVWVKARKEAPSNYRGQRSLATLKVAYVWFMEHFNSPFKARYPNNEIARDESIRRSLRLDSWNALKDKSILAARKVYSGDLSYMIDERLLKNARIVANTMADHFEALANVASPDSKDIAKRPTTIMKDLKEVGALVDDLKDIETRARASQKKSNLFGKKDKNVFEDPPKSTR